MTQKSVRTVVGYSVDRPSIARVVEGNKQIRDSVVDVKDVLGELGPVAKMGALGVEQGFNRLDDNIEGLRRDVLGLENDLRGLDDLVVTPEVRVKRTGADLESGRQAVGDYSTTFGALASVLGGSSALGGSAAAVGDLLGMVEYLPLAARGLGQLNPLLLAAIPITGAFAIGLSALSDGMQRATERVQKYFEQQAKLADLQGETSDVIQGAIDARMDEYNAIEAQRAQYAPLVAAIERINTEGGDYSDLLDYLSQQLGGQVVTTQEVTARYNDLTDQSTLLNFELDALNLLLRDNTTATADLKIVEQQLAEYRANEAAEQQSRWDNIIAAGVSALLAADDMTAQQRQDRITEIQREIEVLTQAAQSTNISAEYAEQLGDRIAGLNSEMLTLQSVSDSTADALERQAQATEALKDATDSVLDANEQYVEAQEELFEAQQAVAESAAEAAREERKLAEDHADKVAKIRDDGAEREVDIAEKRADAIEKVEKEFTRTHTNAVGDRDALMAHQARDAKQDQLEDQNRADQRARDALRRQIERQLSAQESAYTQQYFRLLEANMREAQQRQDALIRAQVDAQNALAIQQAMYSSYIRVAYDAGVSMAQAYVFGLQAGSPAAYDFYGMGYGSGGSAPVTIQYSPTITGGSADQQLAIFRRALHEAGFGVRAGGR